MARLLAVQGLRLLLVAGDTVLGHLRWHVFGYRCLLHFEEVQSEKGLVKVSVIGVGMRSHAGVAQKIQDKNRARRCLFLDSIRCLLRTRNRRLLWVNDAFNPTIPLPACSSRI